MRKKFLLPLLSLLALPATAQTTFTYNGVLYEVLTSNTAGTYFDEDYTNSYLEGTVEIPETVYDESNNAYTVTQIGENSFDSGLLTGIVLPTSIITIGDSAFAESELISINIPEGITSIGEYAFYECEKLTEVYLPSSLQSIGARAFAYVPLKSIVCLATSFPKLGDSYVFYGFGTDAVLYVPAESVKDYYFGDGDGNYWYWFNNVLPYSEDGSLPSNAQYCKYNDYYFEVYNLAENTLQTLSGTSASYQNYLNAGQNIIPGVIPYYDGELTVVGIGAYSFYFADSNINGTCTVEIPETVTFIDQYAFYGCTKLTNVTFAGDSPALSTIGNYAFAGSSSYKVGLKELDLSKCENLVSLGEYVFYYNNIESLILSNSITSMGKYAINQCTSLKEVVLPLNLSQIGDNLIRNCTSMTTGVIPAALANGLDDRAPFRGDTNLENTYIYAAQPPVLENGIGNVFYNGTPMKNLFVPANSLQAYQADSQWNQFENIYAIEFDLDDINYTVTEPYNVQITSVEVDGAELEIPNAVEFMYYPFNVTEIAEGAINGANLTSVTIESLTPPSAAGAFTNLNSQAVLYVPAEAVDAYMAADGWKEFSKIRPIGYEVPVDEDSFTVSPADGDAVAELATLTISSSFTDLKGQGSSITINNNATDVTTSNNQNGELVITLESPITGEGEYAVVIPAGFFTYVYENFEEDSPELSLTIKVDSTVSVEEINVSTLRNAEYYNLNGVRVDNRNLNPGIYVVRQGEKTFKVVVR